MKIRHLIFPIACIGIAIAFVCAGKYARTVSSGAEIESVGFSSSTTDNTKNNQMDISVLYSQVQEKFINTIEKFNNEHGTQFAIATPNDLEISGNDAQQVYQNMLNMTQEEYWNTLEKAYEDSESFSLEDDEI